MLQCIIEHLGDVLGTATSIRIVLDDTPTKRYGKKVEGAGYHHNPTPGKTDATLCFGHSWVVVALVITHPLFGEVSFPIAAELYLRQGVYGEEIQEQNHHSLGESFVQQIPLLSEHLPTSNAPQNRLCAECFSDAQKKERRARLTHQFGADSRSLCNLKRMARSVSLL
jgi:hypothetical protein